MSGRLVYASAKGPGVWVTDGPWLLANIEDGTGLLRHRGRFPAVQEVSASELATAAESVALRGRGGAGFPFATKLRAVAERHGPREVVVNVSEGEPASYKDAALALTRPHLILDGALLAALAVKAGRIHVVLPGEHQKVRAVMEKAIAERASDPVRWETRTATSRFVAGQAQAVLQLLTGKENLPVTAWEPEAFSGLFGRPTLLSNAETYANLAMAWHFGTAGFASVGLPDEPGTMLMTLAGESATPMVVEVPFGTPWERILGRAVLERPVLLGGFHGAWVPGGVLSGHVVSRVEAQELGFSLGAGIVLPLMQGACPLRETARIVRYLAEQSAQRCGPCMFGLPALAEAVSALARGRDTSKRVLQLTGQLPGRGACAHPDGTVRLVVSLMRNFHDEVTAHAEGHCTFSESHRPQAVTA
ncbi:MAG: NADH-ubiquinone oxidoreductase-F iron-sulfur binding region domain-containing protein [Propionibacteriaceae bacterium]|nr:NADH-quinone oxidoreductase subunit I [Micropruina sp.]HBX82609.1 NADH-quinone oxidoreductase subunit I [Propionibacteriaceae bacterium]HBY22937.1 NADH-quinone oxidoreductase subunit I [Propionibacteriaceae bacterium]